MSTEAVITPLAPEEGDQTCRIEGCGKPAVYHVMKLPEGAAEQERFFCEQHGVEFANRGHLVISENV